MQAFRRLSCVNKRSYAENGTRENSRLRDPPEVGQKFGRVAREVEGAMPRASLRRKHQALKLALALTAVDGQSQVSREHIREAAKMSAGD